MDILTLLMFSDQLTEADDGQLVAFFEPAAIGLDESNLGAIDALFLDPGKKFVGRALMFLDQGVPRDNLLVHAGDVFKRIVYWNRKAIGVLPGQTLKIFDDVKQVAGRQVARFRCRATRRATVDRQYSDSENEDD